MGAPREYGGGGLGTFDMCVLTEEMAQHRMGLYNPGCGVFGRTPPPVIYAGTEEQKRSLRRRHDQECVAHVFRDHRAVGRLRSGRRDPVQGGSPGRHLRP